jgi:hypothetical protein
MRYLDECRRPVTSEARVLFWANPCESSAGRSGFGSGFPPSTEIFSGAPRCVAGHYCLGGGLNSN